MKQYIVDLHIHSKYSRACSKELMLPTIARACETRGIDIVATGDFTHPAWFQHMQEALVEASDGIYKLRHHESPTRFVIGTEIASIKKHAGQTRRVHHLIFAPSLETAARFTRELEDRGINVKADGRPIIGLTSKEILEIMLHVDSRMVMIPAHAWTPWFGVFGSKGGYESLEECYEDLTPHIRAIETGLSSDPLMNRRWSALDDITLISNSDAHSPQKLGREANVLFLDETWLSYDTLMHVIRTGDKKQFLHTIEFYPEEGKYHLDGHAVCGVVLTPEQTIQHHGICPVCKKPLTIGVMNRVNELSDRTDDGAKKHLPIPYKSLVPLPEIIADVFDVGVASKKVSQMYDTLIQKIGNEFFILRDAPLENIAVASTQKIADAIGRVREGRIYIQPGFDGVFGVVKVFKDVNDRGNPVQKNFDLE